MVNICYTYLDEKTAPLSGVADNNTRDGISPATNTGSLELINHTLYPENLNGLLLRKVTG